MNKIKLLVIAVRKFCDEVDKQSHGEPEMWKAMIEVEELLTYFPKYEKEPDFGRKEVKKDVYIQK